jgi:hypothetical protein
VSRIHREVVRCPKKAIQITNTPTTMNRIMVTVMVNRTAHPRHGRSEDTHQRRGVRAVKISFAALFMTTTLQVVVVFFSNSVALLADTFLVSAIVAGYESIERFFHPHESSTLPRSPRGEVGRRVGTRIG